MNRQVKIIAVFASGNGSNFEAIAQSIKDGKVNAKIGLLVCDNEAAFALKRAERLGIPSTVFEPKTFDNKLAYEKAVLKELQKKNVECIVLAGYMRIIGKILLEAYPNRIINIHPSLLPNYPGRFGIKDAFEDKVTKTGVSVHLVDEGIDTGPILGQEEVAIDRVDTLESLEEKIHAVEHELYPKVLQEYLGKLKEKKE